MFMLVSRRYERASLIVTSNKPFSVWGGFRRRRTAAAMIDWLVHHAEILLKGDYYRLKDYDIGARPAPKSLERLTDLLRHLRRARTLRTRRPRPQRRENSKNTGPRSRTRAARSLGKRIR